jgi:hypothetical protein
MIEKMRLKDDYQPKWHRPQHQRRGRNTATDDAVFRADLGKLNASLEPR